MSFGWIGAVVQGAKDFHDDVKTGITTQWSYINNKKDATRAYRRQRALYMLDYNLHTPSNQMKLLKEANLNPNLVYGEGNAGSVAVHMPSVDKASPMQVNSVDRGGPTPFGAYMEGKLQEQQLANLEQSRQESLSRTKLNATRDLVASIDALDRYRFGAGTNSSLGTKMLGLVYRAADSSYSYLQRLFNKESENSSDGVGSDKAEVKSSIPPVRATDRSLYDYLYDGNRKPVVPASSAQPYRLHNWYW